MNKIFKYLIGIGAIFTIGINLCNAQSLEHGIYSKAGGSYNSPLSIQGISGYITCINGSNNDSFNHARWTFDSTKVNDYSQMNTFTNLTGIVNRNTYCFEGDYTLYLKPESVAYGTLEYYISKIKLEEKNCPTCPSCQECEEQYTSLECQQEYNLIPLSSVTASYCELNFNLIDPSTCPINEGTGVVNWSSLFINNTQYAGNDNIEIFIPDFIGWSIIYNSGTNYIDIEGYNADEDYINTIIDQEKMTPTADDFAMLMQGTANFIPYLFIGLLIIFMVKIFSKIWK